MLRSVVTIGSSCDLLWSPTATGPGGQSENIQERLNVQFKSVHTFSSINRFIWLKHSRKILFSYKGIFVNCISIFQRRTERFGDFSGAFISVIILKMINNGAWMGKCSNPSIHESLVTHKIFHLLPSHY